MPRIQNNTGRVVTVYGEHFCKQIPIDKDIILTDVDLQGEKSVKVKYFSSSDLKGGWSYVEGKSVTGKYKPELYNRSIISLITDFTLPDDSDVILEKKDNSLPILILLFKRIDLSSISPIVRDKTVNNKTLFQSIKDKKKLTRYLCLEAIIITILAIMLLATTIQILFGNDEIGLKVTASIITILFIYLSSTDLFHLITSRKRKVETHDNSK